MKICITAANCFIGLPLVKKAAELGWEVIAVVRVGNKQKDFIGTIQNTKVIELNLEDYDQLGALVGPVDCAVLLTWNGTRGKTKLNFGTVPYTAAGIVSIQPDIHKLKSTGWKPKVSFKDGVEKIVKAMEK